jgi:multimeric flavodoxin WrbA
MKNFMDRTNPYCKNKKWKGKKAVLVAVGGATKRSLLRCGKTIKDFLWIHGIKLLKTGYFMAEKPTDGKKFANEARKLGKLLTKS